MFYIALSPSLTTLGCIGIRVVWHNQVLRPPPQDLPFCNIQRAWSHGRTFTPYFQDSWAVWSRKGPFWLGCPSGIWHRPGWKVCCRDYVRLPELTLSREEIGILTSLPLLRNVVSDLEAARNNGQSSLTVYFTKESHIHTLVNLVLLSGLPIANRRIPELDYAVRPFSSSLIVL